MIITFFINCNRFLGLQLLPSQAFPTDYVYTIESSKLLNLSFFSIIILLLSGIFAREISSQT